MGKAEEFYFTREQRRKLVERESAIVPDRHETQLGASSLGQQLPGHEVTVMLHFREEDHITSANKFPAPCLRDKIYAFGSSTGENYFVGTGGAQVVRHPLSRFFVGCRRPRAQFMQTTMHIGVFVLVVISKRIQHISRFLRRRGVVKVDQRMAVRLFAEDREIFANGVPVYGATCELVHAIICFTLRCAPP